MQIVIWIERDNEETRTSGSKTRLTEASDVAAGIQIFGTVVYDSE